MGLTISSLFGHLFGKKHVKILMVGLDGAGKTTILNKLKGDEIVTTVPTIGFNVETVEYGNISFTVWDCGGQDKIRLLWRHYFEGTQAIIFVIDSHDRRRLEEAVEELQNLLKNEELRDVILLVFANKQDKKYAMYLAGIADMIRSCNFSQRWHIQGACATQGHGLYEGLNWLSSQLAWS